MGVNGVAMTCSECGGELVLFAVPEDLREFGPGQVEVAAVCESCLALEASGGTPNTPSFESILEGFPSGDGGVAMVLALGLLVESVALNRQAVLRLFDRVVAEGADPWLVLERLAVTPTVDPGIDLLRVKRQLEQLHDAG